MSFIRPEVRDVLLRWREALIGLVIVGLGIWWAVDFFGIQRWLGVAAIFGGLAMVWEGVRRGRFQPGSGGPGVVDVDERQITYFGPMDGGAISIDALTRVTILTTDEGPIADDVHWLFEAEDAPPLLIPATAKGADQLFDALSALPGADYEAVLKAMGSTLRERHLIWEKAHRRLH